MDKYYTIFKALHIIFVISWMVGLLYLPRLYVYHSNVKVDSEADIIFRTMERRLLRYIMNPAMILTIIFGLLLAKIYGFESLGLSFHIKMLCVTLLVIFHHLLGKWRKDFEIGQNKHTARFYRFMNEFPTIMLIICVFMVVLKPFD